MKLVICVLFFVLSVIAEKEVFDSNTKDATAILTEKLWTQIKKRLKDYGYTDTELDHLDRELDDEQCIYSFKNGSIIRTHDSIEAGATFINSQIGISKEDCLTECCSYDNCNVAVFKEKDNDHSCYLFDCGTPNICKFTNHTGYTVIELPSRTTSDKELEKHEYDLEQLAEVPTTTTSTTTTTTTVATTTKATPEPQPQQPVSLFGKCEQHKDCAGSWSQCLGGYCVCKDGYHEQEGTCRKDCSKFEFECHNTGQPLVYPQCVAIYNKCDGIKLCKDGSDEEDCNMNGKKVNHLKQRPINYGKNKNSNVDDDNEDGGENIPTKQEGPGLQNGNSGALVNSKEVSASETDDSSSSDATKSDDKQDKNIKLINSDAGKVNAAANTSVGEKKEEQIISSNKSVSDAANPNTHKAEDNSLEKNSNDVKVSDKEKTSKSSSDVASVGGLVQVVLSEEDGVQMESREGSGHLLAGFYQSNKGAVVALSLGLCITAMLLIFIGCRLRNVKKHLRRGRPLNSNEADYLINGMYL